MQGRVRELVGDLCRSTHVPGGATGWSSCTRGVHEASQSAARSRRSNRYVFIVLFTACSVQLLLRRFCVWLMLEVHRGFEPETHRVD